MCAFFWCWRRDCDSRRELRALVVRRENSSTGRVFYTAPTSNPVAHTMQKHPDKKSGCLHMVRMTGFEPTRLSTLEPDGWNVAPTVGRGGRACDARNEIRQ